MHGSGEIEHAQPGAVDGGGEGVEAVDGHGAEIRQGFHQRQGQPRHDGRPGHGQADPEECSHRALAEAARSLEGGQPAADEGRPGQQVHVGVESQHQDKKDAARSADRLEQGRRGAEPVAPGRLDRAGVIEHAQVDEGEHVGRERQGEHQQRIENPAERILAAGRQPGQADAEDGHPDAHDNHHQGGVADQPRQQVAREMLPDVGLGLCPAGQQHQQRDADEQQQRADQPAPIGPRPQPEGNRFSGSRHDPSGARPGPGARRRSAAACRPRGTRPTP